MTRGFTHIVAIGGALLSGATTAAGQEAAPTVPSGISLVLQEVRVDQVAGKDVVRFRYVAPQLEKIGFATIEADFGALCTTQVLPWLAGQGRAVTQAVVSIASAPVEFGVAAPEVTQFFEAYRLDDGACIWEGL